MNEKTLNELQQLYNAATPGPYEADGAYVDTFHPDAGVGPVCEASDIYPRGINHPAETMAWIAAAHNAFPSLLAELRRCWAELGESDQIGMVSILTESRRASCK